MKEEEVAEDVELDDFSVGDNNLGRIQEHFAKSVAELATAYVTAPPKQHDTAWYPNSGASHHVTNDPSNFITTQTSLDPNEQLLVGNGAGIPILHSGFAELDDK
ncbi:hypothetical protein PIB30_080299 [Stylosanthes scabra]|uniref:Uncharacterized protein n=1 Tax=Stylosanthes scabra TaxID=79078 RepID=A0ABU6VQ44_9FABA|nr:hypothetical protein [Stylosanthes scabra]